MPEDIGVKASNFASEGSDPMGERVTALEVKFGSIYRWTVAGFCVVLGAILSVSGWLWANWDAVCNLLELLNRAASN